MELLYMLMAAHVGEHPVEEIGIVITILGIGGALIKLWYSARKAKAELEHAKHIMAREDEHKLKLEQKLENDESFTMSGGKNPGRTTAQLVEMIHDNQKRFEESTNKSLSDIREFMGRVKEKLNMP